MPAGGGYSMENIHGFYVNAETLGGQVLTSVTLRTKEGDAEVSNVFAGRNDVYLIGEVMTSTESTSTEKEGTVICSITKTRQRVQDNFTTWYFDNVVIQPTWKRILFKVTSTKGVVEASRVMRASYVIVNGDENTKQYVAGNQSIEQNGAQVNRTTVYTLGLRSGYRDLTQLAYAHSVYGSKHLDEGQKSIISDIDGRVTKSKTFNPFESPESVTQTEYSIERTVGFYCDCSKFVGRKIKSVVVKTHPLDQNVANCYAGQNDVYLIGEVISWVGKTPATCVLEGTIISSTNVNRQAVGQRETVWSFDEVEVQPTWRAIRFTVSSQQGVVETGRTFANSYKLVGGRRVFTSPMYTIEGNGSQVDGTTDHVVIFGKNFSQEIDDIKQEITSISGGITGDIDGLSGRVDAVENNITTINQNISQIEQNQETFSQHISNTDVHVTSNDKSIIASVSGINTNLTNHVNNADIHITPQQATDIESNNTHRADDAVHVNQSEKATIASVSGINTNLTNHINNASVHITTQQASDITSNNAHRIDSSVHVTSDDKSNLETAFNHVSNASVHVTADEKTTITNAATHIADTSVHLSTADKMNIDTIGSLWTVLSEHTGDADVHLSSDEKTTLTDAASHISNSNIHVTSDEKNQIAQVSTISDTLTGHVNKVATTTELGHVKLGTDTNYNTSNCALVGVDATNGRLGIQLGNYIIASTEHPVKGKLIYTELQKKVNLTDYALSEMSLRTNMSLYHDGVRDFYNSPESLPNNQTDYSIEGVRAFYSICSGITGRTLTSVTLKAHNYDSIQGTSFAGQNDCYLICQPMTDLDTPEGTVFTSTNTIRQVANGRSYTWNFDGIYIDPSWSYIRFSISTVSGQVQLTNGFRTCYKKLNGTKYYVNGCPSIENDGVRRNYTTDYILNFSPLHSQDDIDDAVVSTENVHDFSATTDTSNVQGIGFAQICANHKLENNNYLTKITIQQSTSSTDYDADIPLYLVVFGDTTGSDAWEHVETSVNTQIQHAGGDDMVFNFRGISDLGNYYKYGYFMSEYPIGNNTMPTLGANFNGIKMAFRVSGQPTSDENCAIFQSNGGTITYKRIGTAIYTNSKTNAQELHKDISYKHLTYDEYNMFNVMVNQILELQTKVKELSEEIKTLKATT